MAGASLNHLKASWPGTCCVAGAAHQNIHPLGAQWTKWSTRSKKEVEPPRRVGLAAAISRRTSLPLCFAAHLSVAWPVARAQLCKSCYCGSNHRDLQMIPAQREVSIPICTAALAIPTRVGHVHNGALPVPNASYPDPSVLGAAVARSVEHVCPAGHWPMAGPLAYTTRTLAVAEGNGAVYCATRNGVFSSIRSRTRPRASTR